MAQPPTLTKEKGGFPVKRILMIGTGGTIASEMTEAGLTPNLNSEDLLLSLIHI